MEKNWEDTPSATLKCDLFLSDLFETNIIYNNNVFDKPIWRLINYLFPFKILLYLFY